MSGLANGRLLVSAAVSGGLLAALTGGALAAQLGENPKGVALARAEVRAVSRVHTMIYTQHGYMTLHSRLGKTTASASWNWGSTTVPRGWVRASEHVTVELRDNHVLWTRDVATPNCASGSCANVPIILVTDRSGTFVTWGSPSSHTCFDTATGPFAKVGEVYQRMYGTYAAPVAHGRHVNLTSTYPWFRHNQPTRETDTLSRATDLPVSVHIHVGAKGRYPGLTVTQKLRYARAKRPPDVNRCSGG